MTDNKETPESGPNSKNTQNDRQNEALNLIALHAQTECTQALKYRATANIFLQGNLNSQKEASAFVTQIWQQIQESSRFSATQLSPEDITAIAKKTRSEFVKKFGILENQRDAISEQIEQEFDITPEQKKAISQKIATIPSKDLASYRLASRRYQLVADLARMRNEAVPLSLSVANRLKNIFGDELSDEALAIIQRTEKTGRISYTALKNIWKELDTSGRKQLLSLVNLSISLQDLYEIDESVFSKETLKKEIRENIKTNISPRIKDLLDSSESANIDTIVSDLEWSDISDTYISEDTIADLMGNAKIVLPRKLTAYFQDWLDEQGEIALLKQEQEAKEKELGVENTDNVQTVTPEWIVSFRDTLRKKNGTTMTGEGLLGDIDFLNGQESIVFQKMDQTGEMTTFLLITGKNLQNKNYENEGATKNNAPLSQKLEGEKMTSSLGKEDQNTSETPPEVVSTFPQTLEAFNAAISEKLGMQISLKVKDCISIGKPGSNDYNVYRIQSFTENGIILWNGSTAFPAEEISFANLYEFGVENETAQFKILENQLGNSLEFLNIMQANSTQEDVWKDLEIIRDDNGDEHFDFIDRRFDKIKNKKQYFPGNGGNIVEIISIDNGTVQARVGEKFTQSKKDGEPSTAEWSDIQDFPLQYIVQYMNRFSCVPWNNPPREIPSRAVPVDVKTEKGTIKSAFGRLSINDLISGSKKFMDEFKHHLQHGNHLQEQRVMLGIAKKMGLDGWNSEWYADFKSQYENGEKKLIEERLETLGKMGTPDRQKSIRASLLNNGTHDYDHWTNALCMIEKHGNLYAGGLQDLEGSWIFFKRIAGIPLDGNVNDYVEFQKVIAMIRGKGIDNITEEAVIEEYMKTNSHFPNSQIWRMIKKRVKEGTDGEYNNGGNETEEFINLDQRLAYAMGKFKSKEYAHGIGAMEKVFEKEGSAYKKQSIAFMLAMSRIPERLPRRLLDKFIPLFDQGYVHSPALAFIKDRKSQEKFREAVRTIVEIKSKKMVEGGNAAGGAQMQSDFKKMMEAIGVNTDTIADSPAGAPLSFKADMFEKVEYFWKKYGKEIQHELTANPQWSIMISESLVEKHAALADYKSMLKSQLGDTNVMKEPGGASFMDGDAGAGVISLKPDKFIDKMGLQSHYGGFSAEGLPLATQLDFRRSLEMIRDKDDINEADKKAWFKNIYTQYVKKISATSDLKLFLEHPTVQPFNRLGLVPPPFATSEKLTQNIEFLKKEIQDRQLSISENKAKLEQSQRNILPNQPLSPLIEWEITKLNKQIIEETQIANDLQTKLRNEENRVGQYVAYDELNTDHQAHFERQFNVLMGREQPSIVIDNTSTRSNKIKDTTSTRVRKVVEKKTDYGLGGTGEAGESTPGFKGASYTDITA